MRLVFMGTPDFSVPSLRLLHEAGHDIASVVTAPDRKRGRGQKLSPTPVKQYADTQAFPVLQPETLKDPGFVDRLRRLEADCFVVVAFRILPEEIFALPPRGSFNLHASLLPKYRGAAPINWALIKGERESGVTTFFLRRKVDTGGIILQEPVDLHENMTAGQLHDMLAEIGAEVVVRTAAMIADGTVEVQPQDDAQATPAPKIFRDTCRIEWTRSARAVHDHIRGLSPHPAAWTTLGQAQMQILISRVNEEESVGTPGCITHEADVLRVQCGSGSLHLHEIKPEGRRPMTVGEYLRGHQIAEGAVFGE
ncbi:MAG: methionyl-tRNA formyltransferase [Bacteroidota bacterium]|nr:methionyl-tRNA formyltransferase [Bacteroidota bacterium]